MRTYITIHRLDVFETILTLCLIYARMHEVSESPTNKYATHMKFVGTFVCQLEVVFCRDVSQ